MRRSKVDGQRQPAIWFRRREDGRSTLSKLGGRPTLPTDIEWPRHGQASTPLHFLAQIDLSILPRTPLHNAPEQPKLPKRGLLFFFADMVEEMLWGDNGGPFATTRVIFAKQAGPEREPPDDTPEILHAFGRRAGGFETGMIEYPSMALEPHVIDTFDETADPDAAALVASIEKAIGPLPVFTGPDSRDAIDAAKLREYIHELNDRRELNLSLHQMLGVATDIQGTAAELQANAPVHVAPVRVSRLLAPRPDHDPIKKSSENRPGPHAMMPSAIAAQVTCTGQPSGTVSSTTTVIRRSAHAASRVASPRTRSTGKTISAEPTMKAISSGAGYE
jgi:hypothetical protein